MKRLSEGVTKKGKIGRNLTRILVSAKSTNGDNTNTGLHITTNSGSKINIFDQYFEFENTQKIIEKLFFNSYNRRINVEHRKILLAIPIQ